MGQIEEEEKEKLIVRPLPLPHSREAEMAVLSCMLNSNEAFHAIICSYNIDEEDFYFTEHRLVFNLIIKSIGYVVEKIYKHDEIKQFGGVAFLLALQQYMPNVENLEAYIDLVIYKSFLRKLIRFAQETEKEAMEDPVDIEKFLKKIKERFSSIFSMVGPMNGMHTE